MTFSNFQEKLLNKVIDNFSMKELEQIVDIDREILISTLPVYGDVKFWHLTASTESPIEKWSLRTAFYGAKYTYTYFMGVMVYDIVNLLS